MPSEPFLGATLARVVRAHGICGEVACQILTDFPERLLELREVWVADGRGAPRRTAVLRCRLTGGRTKQAVFLLEGVASRNDAEQLAGAELQVPLAARVALPEGRYYVTDLIGCEVFEGETRLGRVREVQFPGEEVAGTPLLVLETEQGELLIPFAMEMCPRIEVGARRIEVVLPEGLRELNRSRR